MRKFSVFSGSRSEYGLLKSLLKKLDTSKNFDLNLIISGSHFLKRYGNTFQEIKNDKIFYIYFLIYMLRKIFLVYKSNYIN